jgi:heat shock protein HtpX
MPKLDFCQAFMWPWGLGLLGFDAKSGGVLHIEHSFSNGPLIQLAMVPATPHERLPQICTFGPGAVEIRVPSGQPETILRCRIESGICDLQHLQLCLHRALNHQRSAQVVGGLVLLLALCGWIVGGEELALSAVFQGLSVADHAVSPDAVPGRCGAKPLRPADMPMLFEILANVCGRARLSRMPDLYYLAAHHNMNAYATGCPDRSAIILTEGLLRGMTLAEVTGILAHEVAHIRNDDAWVMTWAAAMCHTIALTSHAGLRYPRRYNRVPRPLCVLLMGAPVIAHLLYLGLSRIREFDADAVALELVDHPRALVAALEKLECYHAVVRPFSPPPPSEDLVRFLRSHPATSERVSILLKLAA